MPELITVTLPLSALNAAVAALENLGDENPWTADEYDDPADEIKSAIARGRRVVQ